MFDEIDEKLYTIQELAASNRLRISKTTIWREITDGNLPSYKLRGQVFVVERHIREYLGQCEVRRAGDSKFIGSSVVSLALRK
ncbi:MAG: helix-turn-helix domain-containing protein [Acidobacteriota bacterium]|nr:helix-turn-helix domain-containing protein [Acidobacteriota bacterium]